MLRRSQWAAGARLRCETNETGSWPGINERPELPLRELLAEVRQRHSGARYYALWNIVRRAGLSFKKGLHASEQDRPKVARRRQQWKARQGNIDPKRLVFVDETWTKTNMTPIGGARRSASAWLTRRLSGTGKP